MLTQPVYTHSEALAAICLFEAMLECVLHDKTADTPLMRVWANDGVCAMRNISLSNAKLADWLFANAPSDLFDRFTFDWEMCPAIIEAINWENDPIPQDYAALGAKVYESLRKSLYI